MERIRKRLIGEQREGFSLVEIIIVIAIMAILVGVIALAVLPNINRSKESKDISELDNIASAANAAVGVVQAKEADTIKLGTTSTGVQDVAGFDPDTATEQEKLQHQIYETLPDGAGITESAAVGTNADIIFTYDVPNRKVQVAYVTANSVNCGTGSFTPLQAIECDYLSQGYFVSNGG